MRQLRNSSILLLLISLCTSLVFAKNLHDGDKIKIITVRQNALYSTFRAQTVDAYIIENAGAVRDTMPKSEIFQVYRYENKVKTGFIMGAITGTFTGVALTAKKDSDLSTGTKIGAIGGLGVVFGMVGGLIGSNFNSYELNATYTTGEADKPRFRNMSTGQRLKIETADHRVIAGKIRSMDENQIIVTTKDYGDVTIRQSEISRLYKRSTYGTTGAITGLFVAAFTSPLLFDFTIDEEDDRKESADAGMYGIGCMITGIFIGSRFKKYGEVIPDENYIGFDIRQNGYNDHLFCLTMRF
ncbi:MAG: hypothetical protein R3F48_02405 [Candidatus Zixiibacteriota bacterium]